MIICQGLHGLIRAKPCNPCNPWQNLFRTRSLWIDVKFLMIATSFTNILKNMVRELSNWLLNVTTTYHQAQDFFNPLTDSKNEKNTTNNSFCIWSIF